MKNKLLFFDLRRNFVLNIIIILQVALSLLYTASLISLSRFEKSYIENFYDSIQTEDTTKIAFYNMMMSSNGNLNENVIIKTLDCLDKNKYPYGIFKSENGSGIKINGKNLNEIVDAKSIKIVNNDIYQLYFNEGMIDKYNKRIEGNLNLDSWNYKGKKTPIILGWNFKDKIKVNQSFKDGDREYEVVGFFKENTMAFNDRNSVTGSIYLDSMAVLPLTKSMFLDGFDYEPIILYEKNIKEEKTNKVKEEIKSIRSDVEFRSFEKDVIEFLDALKAQITYETISTLIIVILSIASLLSVILYKILNDRDRIGILYSFGVSKGKISFMFFRELTIFMVIGTIIGSLIYLNKGELVFSFFINRNILENIALSILGIFIIIIILISITISKISKMTPKDLIGGFIE
ncbi:MAG: FtsX-like permease family protein [Clostridium sp.]|uniref:FtsX-like permease family protein n=1 Tax=Clostridium chrysemydis TaxID=2665504 RepID=UPI003EE6225D